MPLVTFLDVIGWRCMVFDEIAVKFVLVQWISMDLHGPMGYPFDESYNGHQAGPICDKILKELHW